MRPIKNENLGRLLLQLRFTPQKHRQKQLEAAENLLRIIDAEKEYPFEFVCFRITGYHPKNLGEHELIRGEELSEDLRIFISRLSGRLAPRMSQQQEKVYTVEELAAQLSVSTKTIDRWRRRGLLARKFIFDDGRKRLGFFQSAVDEFLNRNPDVIAKASSFGRLTNKEKQRIVRRACALAAKGGMSRHQVIARIAKETHRAHETIRYTVMSYEIANPQNPVFGKAFGAIQPGEAAELYKLFKQGGSVTELMSRFARSKSSIYRLINLQRAKAIQARKIEFIASEEFFKEGAKEEILGKPVSWKRADSGPRAEPFELAGDSLLPEYMQTLKNAPVLDRETEQAMFRRYNYLKYLASVTRTGLSLSHVSGFRLKEVEGYLAEAESIKQMIIEANLRLVISVAMKHTTSGMGLSDLVSEGNFSLMQAVEKFDYTRGFRFSSLASWAIAKDYARRASDEGVRVGRSRTAYLRDVHLDLRSRGGADVAAVERARQSLTQVIKEDLNEREEYIILNHFGLLGSPVKKTKKTLAAIGEDLGISKERVRQIELVALQKLRHSLSAEQFELLTG
ncbi:MAG TPA: sigma-70 family RNA polymerase sigma factor [Sedimentisphaerales bacterium]|nr:sigma-70 family RNA polymerase sigma factor [Sedimentisphaerales bacterium]